MARKPTKARKDIITATRLRIILVLCLVLTIGASIGTVVMGQSVLKENSSSVTEAVKAEKASSQLLSLLQQAKERLKTQDSSYQKSKQLVASDVQTAYQQQVINDINLYAQKAGISVKGYTFEESSAASNAKSPSSTSSSSAAAPAKPSSSGPSSARVVLAVDSPIAYDSLLKFLKLLNTSLPQIYLSELSLARNEHSGDAGRPVNLESLTLEVYLNK